MTLFKCIELSTLSLVSVSAGCQCVEQVCSAAGLIFVPLHNVQMPPSENI